MLYVESRKNFEVESGKKFNSLPSVKKHSANHNLCRVPKIILGKEIFAECKKIHSAPIRPSLLPPFPTTIRPTCAASSLSIVTREALPNGIFCCTSPRSPCPSTTCSALLPPQSWRKQELSSVGRRPLVPSAVRPHPAAAAPPPGLCAQQASAAAARDRRVHVEAGYQTVLVTDSLPDQFTMTTPSSI